MKKGYKTQQRQELLAFLQERKGQHFTVADLYDFFRKTDAPIGMTTLYRQMEGLVRKNLVRKYLSEPGRPACFEYVGEHPEEENFSCYHFKCMSCGALLHVTCHEMEGFSAHMEKEHHFLLDPHRTVFYGLCPNCHSAKDEG